jgi:hypothetical protein
MPKYRVTCRSSVMDFSNGRRPGGDADLRQARPALFRSLPPAKGRGRNEALRKYYCSHASIARVQIGLFVLKESDLARQS